MDCTPEDVFAVLEDGWCFGMWVVGAARIRDVAVDWPAKGSKIHHSVGVWPLLLSDDTEVEAVDAPRRLQLRVRAWPAGNGRVTITCEARDGKTVVIMEEQAMSGPASVLPDSVEDLLLHPRNVEALRRLSYLAEHRARSHG